jgi:hypothetical protein
VNYRRHNNGTAIPSKIEANGQSFDIRALDEIANKNKLSKKSILYSGVKHNPTKHIDESGILHLPAYTSTSELRSVAHKFAKVQAIRQDDHENGTKADGHIIRFHLKAGHRQ